MDRTSDKFLLTLGQDHGNFRSKTVFTSKPPTFIRDEIVYSKSHHLVKRKESNINGNFKKDVNLTKHISERLRKMVMLERM